MSATVNSRLPKIAAELAVRVDAVGRLTAERVAEGAREHVSVGAPDVHLQDHITVEHIGVGEFEVRAGDTDVFYGHIVEHGSVFAEPRPFMVPAAEVVRADIDTLARRALANL